MNVKLGGKIRPLRPSKIVIQMNVILGGQAWALEIPLNNLMLAIPGLGDEAAHRICCNDPLQQQDLPYR